jgi:hypothetical protein
VSFYFFVHGCKQEAIAGNARCITGVCFEKCRAKSGVSGVLLDNTAATHVFLPCGILLLPVDSMD